MKNIENHMTCSLNYCSAFNLFFFCKRHVQRSVSFINVYTSYLSKKPCKVRCTFVLRNKATSFYITFYSSLYRSLLTLKESKFVKSNFSLESENKNTLKFCQIVLFYIHQNFPDFQNHKSLGCRLELARCFMVNLL